MCAMMTLTCAGRCIFRDIRLLLDHQPRRAYFDTDVDTYSHGSYACINVILYVPLAPWRRALYPVSQILQLHKQRYKAATYFGLWAGIKESTTISEEHGVCRLNREIPWSRVERGGLIEHE